MKSSDVLQPLILREAYPRTIADAAAAEVLRICRSMENLANTPGLTMCSPNDLAIWVSQRGVNLARIQKDYVQHIFKVIAFMEEIIGYKCDPGESSVRAQDPSTEWPKLPWHQDGAGMRPAEDSIVAWVPLTPIDGNTPTIEFSKLQMTQLLEHERNSNRFLEVENNGDAGSTIVTDLEPGAVVIFSPWTLHRTYRTREMKDSRLSLDLRFYQ